jgi:glycosyltransferase involved in cell wall biosynthesis
MATFIPTLVRRLVPPARVVTLFENSIGIVPSSRMPARLMRKVATTLAGRTNLDYEFGTLLRDSHAVIVLSDVHRHQLTERSPASAPKMVLMPAPPSLPPADDALPIRERIRQRLGISRSSFVVVCVGYMYPDKGIDTLLQAFKLLLQQIADVRLIVVRVAPHPSLVPHPEHTAALMSLAGELELQQHVSWVDGRSWGSRDVMEHLAASDACILPHYYGVQLNHRGFAAAALQGLPTIGIRGRIPEHRLRDGEHLLFCPPKSPEALADAAIDLIRSPELRDRLSAGARNLARSCYSWDAVAAGVTELTFGERGSEIGAVAMSTLR